MGTPEPSNDTTLRRGARRAPAGARTRRSSSARRSFTSTLTALDALSVAGAHVSLKVIDLDSGSVVLSGDEHVTLPVGGIGIVPLLIEVAARMESGSLDPFEIVDRASVDAVAVAGVWRHLKAPALPIVDLAVLAAATGDALAANALLDRVGLDAVRERLGSLGLRRTALLDRFRDERGPDDAPQVALSSPGELAELFAGLVNSDVVSAAVSTQVAEWLSLNEDLSLVASAMGLDPFAHDDDPGGLLFVNKTGRGDGVLAEAGVVAGPRAGVAYALLVGFDDLSVAHRLRAHDAFRTLGVDLMEYVH
ncbi:serine hydrolase [Microbacterium sp. bgisy189]|uniref:serine hydrolase n=1 Tax=Microbacterium sp. bgisy189 TaxID=3413798 RepID=UPI003EBBBA0D